MKVLISPMSMEEAEVILACDRKPDILDIKNVAEGSLGAQFPHVIKAIVEKAHKRGMVTSATLGDLPHKPGTAAQASFGVAHCGADYIKAGLYGSRTVDEATQLMAGVVDAVGSVNPKAKVVASGYGDFARFGGLHWRDLVEAAKRARCAAVLIDTYIKDGRTLFDNMSKSECQEFCDSAKQAGMEVALAGSIREDNLDLIFDIDPTFIGVRGAVCGKGNRQNLMTADRIVRFLNLVDSRSLCQAA